MSLEMGLLLGVIACVLFVWYLYRRSQNETSEDTEQQADAADKLGDDAYEDLLLTGLVLDEVYNDDDDNRPDDAGSDGFDSVDDSGGFDDGGFE